MKISKYVETMIDRSNIVLDEFEKENFILVAEMVLEQYYKKKFMGTSKIIQKSIDTTYIFVDKNINDKEQRKRMRKLVETFIRSTVEERYLSKNKFYFFNYENCFN
jgi:hypothetical protein|tara:strand:- start:412 stop:729 length:318 start_codon:yes stop_codon:yes gene_type:complete